MAKELTPRADELKGLGWSPEEVARYAELWDYRQRWGAINLEREDRQFLRKAEAALPKITSGKASIRKPLKEKSYYRWLSFYLEVMSDFEKKQNLVTGARGVWSILLEEELRVLEYFEPILGLPDTLKAKELLTFREDLVKRAMPSVSNRGKSLTFDYQAPILELKSKQNSNWQPIRDGDYATDTVYNILSADDIEQFRKEVYSELVIRIRDLFPSLADTDKPLPI